MKWIVGAVAAALVAGYTFTYVLVRRLLNEDWQPDWDLDATGSCPVSGHIEAVD